MLERLMGLKKDKITKLIEKGEESFYDDFKKNNLSFLDAHYKMQDIIEDVYITNTFYYQELLDRKRFLTSFKNLSINMSVSFLLGILTTLVFNLIIDISSILSSPNPLVNYVCEIIKLIFFIGFITYVTRKIFKTAKFISRLDYYNTNEFELKIIDEQIGEFENKRISK